MSPRTAWLFAGVFALVVGFLVTGSLLYGAPIGLDQTAWPAGQWIFDQLSRLGEVPHGSVVGAVWAGSPCCSPPGSLSGRCAGQRWPSAPRRIRAAGVPDGHRDRGRRRGLGAAGVSGLAAGARAFYGIGQGSQGWAGVNAGISGGGGPKTHEAWLDTWKGSEVQSYRRLGRTDFEVSDIVFGAGPLKGPQGEQIARLAIERGVNYLDTSPDYSATGSEALVGKAIAGQRDKLFLRDEVLHADRSPSAGDAGRATTSRDRSTTVSRRLGTDYVDLVHVHSCDEVDRLLDPNMHAAFEQLKAAGKARFLGVLHAHAESSRGGERGHRRRDAST